MRSITFRLNLWYALTFLLSVAVLFVALYFLVAAAVQRQDREIVEARLKELAAIYNNGGAASAAELGATQRRCETRKTFHPRRESPERSALPQRAGRLGELRTAAVRFRSRRGRSSPCACRAIEQRDFTIAATDSARWLSAAGGPHREQPRDGAATVSPRVHRRGSPGVSARHCGWRARRAPHLAAGSANRGHGGVDHQHRKSQRARARRGNQTMNWIDSRISSIACSNRTRN